METLTLPGGDELSTDEAQKKFAEAMAVPEPSDETAPSPKRREAKEPGEAKPEHSKPRVSNAAPAPAKRGRKPGQASSANAPKDYTEDLTGICQIVYGTFAATGNLADAGAVKHHGPGMAAAWNAAAQDNAYVRRGVEWLTKGGVWGAVMMSTMPFALQVMVNHGQLPVEKVAALGVKDPDSLAKETEQDIIAMAAMAQAA